MKHDEYDKLSVEEKRIKVAELCGWKPFLPIDDMGIVFGVHPDIDPEQDECGGTRAIPDYLNDLNACHEFEKHVDWDEYAPTLCFTVMKLRSPSCLGDWWDVINGVTHATAEQRCKAFVLTMGGKA